MDAHLRVHSDHITQEVLREFLVKFADRWYIAQEIDATRPHYQGYVRFKPRYMNLESIRNALRKVLTEKGNRVYSISLARESVERHLAYMMKEGNPPILQEGISIQNINTAKGLVQDFKKRQGMSSIEKLADGYTGDYQDIKKIAKYIMEEWKKQGKMIPELRLMKRYIQSIQFYKDPERFERTYLENLEFMFSQN